MEITWQKHNVQGKSLTVFCYRHIYLCVCVCVQYTDVSWVSAALLVSNHSGRYLLFYIKICGDSLKRYVSSVSKYLYMGDSYRLVETYRSLSPHVDMFELSVKPDSKFDIQIGCNKTVAALPGTTVQISWQKMIWMKRVMESPLAWFVFCLAILNDGKL